MGILKSALQVAIGSIAEVAVPSAAREIETGTHSGRHIRLKKWITQSRKLKAVWRGDAAAVERAHVGYWRGDIVDGYYDHFPDRYNDWFLGQHYAIVEQMAALNETAAFERLVEIGCGDGRVLEYCAGKMPGIPLLTGVDINPAIIARNRTHYASNPRLQFVADDAAAWLEINAADDMLLFAYGGVMEYFSADKLSSILRSLARHRNVAVALVEPLDPAHDLATVTASHPFGAEHSFSHNHAHLLREAGFEIEFQWELNLDIRWIMMLATANTLETRASGSLTAP